MGLLYWVKLWVVARKTNLMLIGVLLSVVLVGCSSNATTTVETTVAKVCNPPAQLDCAGADLNGAQLQHADLTWAILSGANLTNANLTNANLTTANLTIANFSGATMPDGTIHP